MTRLPAALTLAALLAPLPALANPTNPSETSTHYGDVRNWLVESLSQDGMFVGCRGTIPLQAAGPLLLERREDLVDGWAIYVPTAQAPATGDVTMQGTLSVDDAPNPVTFRLYAGGWAEVILDPETRQKMMDGNYLASAPEGEESRQWILNGSTAATEMVEECYARQGNAW